MISGCFMPLEIFSAVVAIRTGHVIMPLECHEYITLKKRQLQLALAVRAVLGVFHCFWSGIEKNKRS